MLPTCRLHQWRNGRFGKRRDAANVDLAQHVLLVGFGLTLSEKKVCVPKHWQVLEFDPEAVTQQADPFVLEASSQGLEADVICVAVEALGRQRRVPLAGVNYPDRRVVSRRNVTRRPVVVLAPSLHL